MSFVRLLADGAQEAITLVPLLFTLGVAPAQAQLPRTPIADAVAQTAAIPGEEERPLLTLVRGTALPALVAQHMTIELADTEAQLRVTSVFRNTTDAPIAARYVLPFEVALTTVPLLDDSADVDALADEAGHDCGGDLSVASADEFIEAGEPDPRDQQTGVVWLEPGDEVTLVSTRPAHVIKRDTRRRVVLVLPPALAAQPVPAFSAEIDVEAQRPITQLGSATHGGDVDGLGSSRARLFVPNGKVYSARFLSVDLELGAAERIETARWGNEDRLPIALR